MSIFSEFKLKNKRKNLLKEYESIKALYTKTVLLGNADPLAHKIVETQQGILKNNFSILAKLYADVVQPLNYLDVTTFTNLQGTPPRVEVYEGKLSIERSDLVFYTENSTILDMLGIELKFYYMDTVNLKQTAYLKIRAKAFAKIKSKISTFTKRYGKDATIVEDFILKTNGMLSIQERLIFIATYFNPREELELAFKKIVVIPRHPHIYLDSDTTTQFIQTLAPAQSDYLIQL